MLIVETRKENGEKYPPLMLYQLLSGLHHCASLLYSERGLQSINQSMATGAISAIDISTLL